MDVKLTGSCSIPYLSQGCIEDYSSLKFFAQNGDVVKMNATILVALNSSLFSSLFDFDIDDCCVITEFSRNELEEINEFSWTGQCKNLSVFNALGIDLNAIFYHEKLLNFKLEVKDEELEMSTDCFNEDFLFDQPGEETHLVNKKTKKKLLEKNLTVEQQKTYESYELPKPLQDFKVPAFESKTKLYINAEVDFNKPFACQICGSRFASNQNLQSHVIKLHSEHYNCCFCKKVFALDKVEDFKLHMFKHDNKMLSKCACIQCGIFFQQSYKFHEHIRRKGPYHDNQCTQCSDKFSTHEDYRSHVESKHFGEWVYKCGFCSKKFPEDVELKYHTKMCHLQESTINIIDQLPEEVKVKIEQPLIQRKKYVPIKKICEECGSHVTNLKTHMNTVHGCAKHACPQCSVTFKTTDLLKSHIEWVHVKVPCSECGIMVGRRKMSRHISFKHTSIYDRKFKCDTCGKGFNDKAKLKDHYNVHTGEKPYKCKFCTACFASRGTHAMHQRSHLGHRRSK